MQNNSVIKNITHKDNNYIVLVHTGDLIIPDSLMFDVCSEGVVYGSNTM